MWEREVQFESLQSFEIQNLHVELVCRKNLVTNLGILIFENMPFTHLIGDPEADDRKRFKKGLSFERNWLERFILESRKWIFFCFLRTSLTADRVSN